MANRKLLIAISTGHALKAVELGGDPETSGTVFTDHGDGFYSVELPTDVYDIYFKDSPSDPTWTELTHFQARFHPTDDITVDIDNVKDDVSDHESRISTLEGSTPSTPTGVSAIKITNGIHIRWSQSEPGTLYVIRGEYHHSDENVTIDANSRILFAGFTTECILSNEIRFADIESMPFSDIKLSYRIWAVNNAGTSDPTAQDSIELDLQSELDAFTENLLIGSNYYQDYSKVVLSNSFVSGTFPTTAIDENKLPTGTPALTVSMFRDMRLIRIEIESQTTVNADCSMYFRDTFSDSLYELKIDNGERFARSEETAEGNPSLLVRRYSESTLQIYSDAPSGLSNVEIRLTFRIDS